MPSCCTVSLVAQPCPTLCDPTDCSPPGSSVRGMFQARVLEWVAFPFSKDLPNPGIKTRSPTFQSVNPAALGIDVCMLFYSTATVLPVALLSQLLPHLFHCLYRLPLPVSSEVKNTCKNFDRNFSNCMILKKNDYV